MIPEIKLQYLDEDRNRFIGNQIARARRAKKFKACELADAIGIGKDQYSKIENGKVTCTIDNLFILAQYLELDVQFLLFGSASSLSNIASHHVLDKLNEEEMNRANIILEASFPQAMAR